MRFSPPFLTLVPRSPPIGELIIVLEIFVSFHFVVFLCYRILGDMPGMEIFNLHEFR